MIKLEDIEILRVRYRTLDNGARGVDIDWRTPEIKPSGGLYSLSRDKYDELCQDDSELFNWCKQAVYENEFKLKNEFELMKMSKELEALERQKVNVKELRRIKFVEYSDDFALIKEALKRNEPMKPIKDKENYRCARCHHMVDNHYCSDCGGAVDWSDEK